MWLSPPATEGWLICREPRTGDARWHYRRAGTISHRPAVVKKHVFGVFDRGEVVCLNGVDGTMVWETLLPENPCRTVNPSHDPAWSAVASVDGRVLVVDRNGVLHVLRAQDGKFVASVALSTAFSDDRRTMVPVHLLAMPRIDGERLIVATNRGVAAYRLNSAE